MTHETLIKQRIHITFGKMGALKYTSTLDIAKVWERVLRRANLPILYSKGFNTRPRMQLASALPLGITSECEILDVSLREAIDLAGLAERLLAVSPAGLTIQDITEVDVKSPTLQQMVVGAKYRVTFIDPIDYDDLQGRIDSLLAQDRIIKEYMRKRRKNVIDLRPLIHELYIDEHNDLIADLSAGDRGNVRLEDVLENLGMGDVHYHAHRFELRIESYRS